MPPVTTHGALGLRVCIERAAAKAQKAGHLLVPNASDCAGLHSRVAKVVSIRFSNQLALSTILFKSWLDTDQMCRSTLPLASGAREVAWLGIASVSLRRIVTRDCRGRRRSQRRVYMPQKGLSHCCTGPAEGRWAKSPRCDKKLVERVE